MSPREKRDDQTEHEIVDLDDSPKRQERSKRDSDRRRERDVEDENESEQKSEDENSENKSPSVGFKPDLILLAIILTGLLIRIGLLLMEKQVYVDGIHYLLQGENIRHGIWDTWDPNGARWTVPPFYPLLIAFFKIFTSDLVLAGRIASLVVSISIIPGVYLIAREFTGQRGGRWAAFIAAIDPLCASYSVITYAEPVFMGMVVWSVWFAIRTVVSEKKLIPSICMGLFVYLAYLTKAFGLALFIWGLLILAYYLLRKTKDSGIQWIPVVTYAGVFLILSLPYLIFLTSYLGHPAPDGKSQFEFTRLHAPTLEQERIDPRYEGLINRNYDYTIFNGEPQFGKQTTGVFLKNYAKKYVRKLIEIFIDYPIKLVPPFMNVRFTTPLFLLLLGAGLFSIPLSLNKAPAQGILLFWLPLWLIVAPLSFIEIRYFVPIIPLLIPFVAQGTLRFEDWLKNTIIFRSEKTRILVVPLTVMIILCFSLPSLTYKLTHRDDPDVFYNEYKAAGDFLKDYTDGKEEHIVESAHMIAFYAGMQGWVTPQCDYDSLIRFMLTHGIRFLALDEDLTIRKHIRPDLQWMFMFPPLPTSELRPIYHDDEYQKHRIVIYELDRNLLASWEAKILTDNQQ